MRRLLWSLIAISLFVAFSRAGTGGRDIIVRLKDGHSTRQIRNEYGGKVVRRVSDRPIYLVHVEDTDAGLLRRIRNEMTVDSAEENPRLSFQPPGPADSAGEVKLAADGLTLTTLNGSAVLKAYADQPALRLVGGDRVRSISTGAGTRVGYIDTGIDPYHPALRPWVEPGVDLVSNISTSEFGGLSADMAALLDTDMAALLDQNGIASQGKFPTAWGHGTMVAGVIHLIAPDARLVPIKAFDANGATTMFTLIAAVYSAIDQNVDVLNMSFSLSHDSPLFKESVNEAKARGIAIVASVGNDRRDEKDLYPAAYEAVFGVAATDFNDHVASFSNYGKSVSISAPGAYVISTFPGGRYAAAWGTSFSAPIVSGGMALVAAARGSGHSDTEKILNTADPIDDLNPGFKKKLGKGRINVYRALKK